MTVMTRWRMYILGVFVIAAVVCLLGIRFLRSRGAAISRIQATFFTVGALLTLETCIILRLSNFNLGVILPAFFGLPLVALAFLLPHMDHGFLLHLKRFTALCYAAAFCIFLVCGTLMLRAQHSAEDVDADAVIVLGAAVHGDRVTWVLENRLLAAKTFLDSHPDAICIVTGGQGPGESVSEGSAMKKFLMERGVDESRIYAEEQAANTIENFRFSKIILDEVLGEDAALAYVTTDFHVYRAGRVAAAQGIDAVGIAAQDVWYLRLNNFLRECVGICVYALRGEI